VYLTLGETLRRSRQFSEATLILEMARLKFPRIEKIIISLAHTYMDNDKPLIAAKLFEEASMINPKYISESAELYRLAGHYYRALYLNSQVTDQTVKTKQRLGILLELNRFEEAASLEKRLSRLNLLDDDRVRYAMAYVAFNIGNFEKAREYLSKINDPALFRSATELMKAMEVYKDDKWQWY
jgi:tetratricopeptide (TPR) repeat protein